MLDFDTVNEVTFKVSGQVYSLPPLSFSDVPAVGEALKGVDSPQDMQIDGLKRVSGLLVDLLAAKARCDRPDWLLRLTGRPTPAAAVRSLGVAQQAQLFGEWFGEMKAHGVPVGESSGSTV